MPRNFVILYLIFFLMNCADRRKDNPFDPSGNLPVRLDVLSYDARVDLSWGDPDVVDYNGFRLYRRVIHEQGDFEMIADGLLPSTRSFIDPHVEFEKIYDYYITVLGSGMESRPSNTVTIKPGPGLNWIVDKWGMQLIRTTYDMEHTIFEITTNWPPTDMAVSRAINRGVVLYLINGMVEERTLTGNHEAYYDQFHYPVSIAYDAVDSLFWIADSIGSLYTLDTRNDEVNLISNSLMRPIHVTIAANTDIISVVDLAAKEIVQFNRNGDIVGKIQSLGDSPLQNPTGFVYDTSNDRYWLIDGNANNDFVYTRRSHEDVFFQADSIWLAGDLEADSISGNVWYISYDYQNSKVLQLSPDGTRPIELSGFYNPYDIEINPHDGTLLIVDTGNGRVLHYTRDQELIGVTNNLNFPVKVLVE